MSSFLFLESACDKVIPKMKRLEKGAVGEKKFCVLIFYGGIFLAMEPKQPTLSIASSETESAMKMRESSRHLSSILMLLPRRHAWLFLWLMSDCARQEMKMTCKSCSPEKNEQSHRPA